MFGLLIRDEKGMKVILGRGPWAVMGYLMNLQIWERDKALHELDFSTIAFWIQIHNVPLEMQSGQNAEKIGEVIGNVVMVEDPTEKGSMTRGYMRVRVKVEVQKPLLTSFWVLRRGREKLWAELKYERLYDFCHKCGRLGHVNRVCGMVDEESRGTGDSSINVKRYGLWLRAGPLREVRERMRGEKLRSEVTDRGETEVGEGFRSILQEDKDDEDIGRGNKTRSRESLRGGEKKASSSRGKEIENRGM